VLLGPALATLRESELVMVMIGTDSHKKTHTVVVLDGLGKRLVEKTVAATSDGHLVLVQWAAQWPEVVFALEDCRHLTRRLERDLLGAASRRD
jgi:transposase